MLAGARSERVGVVHHDLQHHARPHVFARRPHREPAFAGGKDGARKRIAGVTPFERMAFETERVQKGRQIGGFGRDRAETETENLHVSFSPPSGAEVKHPAQAKKLENSMFGTF